MTLYINSCVRPESRTDKIAKALLQKLGNEYTELKLKDEQLSALSNDRLNDRTMFIATKDYSDPMFRYAKQFAGADTIVISAPFWDLSFPAMLKTYIENIYVIGIVSEYNQNGIPVGLCKAKDLYYVTSSGGKYIPDYSYNYIRDLATKYFGIENVHLIKAEMLDVDGFDSDKIVEDTINNI